MRRNARNKHAHGHTKNALRRTTTHWVLFQRLRTNPRLLKKRLVKGPEARSHMQMAGLLVLVHGFVLKLHVYTPGLHGLLLSPTDCHSEKNRTAETHHESNDHHDVFLSNQTMPINPALMMPAASYKRYQVKKTEPRAAPKAT